MSKWIFLAIAINLSAQNYDPVHQRSLQEFTREAVRLDETFEAHVYRNSRGLTMPYRLFRPPNSSRKLPLILYLHGGGGLGDDNSRQIKGGNIFGTHVWALNQNQSHYPVFILAPQTANGWSPDNLELAFEILQKLVRELGVDSTRIYVTGQSMGGIGTWDMVAAHPGFFAAAVIVSGGGDPKLAPLVRTTPIWIFHGALDSRLPVGNPRQIIRALSKESNKPKYTEYPNVRHNAWEWAYTDPALPAWLFSQQTMSR